MSTNPEIHFTEQPHVHVVFLNLCVFSSSSWLSSVYTYYPGIRIASPRGNILSLHNHPNHHETSRQLLHHFCPIYRQVLLSATTTSPAREFLSLFVHFSKSNYNSSMILKFSILTKFKPFQLKLV